MRELQSGQSKSALSSASFGKVETTAERIGRFLKAKRSVPHTFIWVLLSLYPFIWGGIGLWQMISLR